MLTGTLPQKLCLLVLLGLHSVGLQLTLGGGCLRDHLTRCKWSVSFEGRQMGV